jgi:hypothetical protein
MHILALPLPQYAMRILNIVLLGAFVVVAPVVLTAALYGLMRVVVYLTRFVPMIGRKHRHSDWDRLNR